MSFNTYPQNPFPSNSELLQKLDEVAKAIDDMPTFTSNDKAFLSELPAFPSTDGKKVLTATTDSGETSLSYEELENELPTEPSADGVKVLTATTTSGETVLSWEEVEGEEYTAGNYISINGNNEISVNKSLPYVGNSYRITSYDTSGEAKIKVTKYEGETLISETIVDHHNVSQPQVFDDRFSIQYSSNWIYKNIVASNDHAANWTKTWGFDQTVDFTERFDNSGDTLAMVKQVNAIKNAIIGASSFTDAQNKLAQL